MQESIQVAARYLEDVQQGYIATSYIPPQGDFIGSETLSRIAALFPDVETVLNRYVIAYLDQLLGDFTTLNQGNQYLYTLTTKTAQRNGEQRMQSILWASVYLDFIPTAS